MIHTTNLRRIAVVALVVAAGCGSSKAATTTTTTEATTTTTESTTTTTEATTTTEDPAVSVRALWADLEREVESMNTLWEAELNVALVSGLRASSCELTADFRDNGSDGIRDGLRTAGVDVVAAGTSEGHELLSAYVLRTVDAYDEVGQLLRACADNDLSMVAEAEEVAAASEELQLARARFEGWLDRN